jgi:hypothetical protein
LSNDDISNSIRAIAAINPPSLEFDYSAFHGSLAILSVEIFGLSGSESILS